ncbi:SLC13 family permease [Cellvibrio sp. OA-2007]|uniref:SLC13 family permease n=1 Tax=Cellvibrio sp. OA-2007 TaxID=529823 RepID=UPI000A930D40|nr:SLC13 family permease [Cellvibrio sp. OA-2007]
MNQQQLLISIILCATMGLFLWGRWRHDLVASGALLSAVLLGVVPVEQAFLGFAHPAVITVACILVLSRGLQISGAVDVLAHRLLPSNSGIGLSLLALIGLGALLSSFMNNVGAMALLMPIALKLAQRLELPPGQVLMPLAFGTILGGMTTLIGTPPNLIVSGFRATHSQGEGFGLFAFAPVGVAVALVGIIFIVFIGWRLVPKREQPGIAGFESGAYLTEVKVPEKSATIGKSLYELEQSLEDSGAQILALIRNDLRLLAPNAHRRIQALDTLVIEVEAKSIASILTRAELVLAETKPTTSDTASSDTQQESNLASSSPTAADTENGDKKPADSADTKENHSDHAAQLIELVVLPNSSLSGTSAAISRLRYHYGINLLAISRQGRRSTVRLKAMRIKPGDLLLLQGSAEAVAEFATDTSCVPLAERELHIPSPRKAWRATGLMLVTLGLVLTGLVPAEIAFALGVLVALITGVVPSSDLPKSIDSSVIVLLAMLIPIAEAMSSTGTAALIAQILLNYLAQDHAVLGLIVILVVTMFLSDLMNNAATAAMMCPIAVGLASALNANPDTFLMAVAIGSSCAFLTPVGHQNNTLILGPGGFSFGDYWRLGLPLELLVLITSVPVLLWVWPL